MEPNGRTLDAVVTLLIPMFEVVHLETKEGLTLCVGEGTPGVDWRDLRVGQRLRCKLEDGLTRVLRAQVLE